MITSCDNSRLMFNMDSQTLCGLLQLAVRMATKQDGSVCKLL